MDDEVKLNTSDTAPEIPADMPSFGGKDLPEADIEIVADPEPVEITDGKLPDGTLIL